MPVPYTQRRQRRQQLAEKLPPELRGRIALRNIETVAKFLPEEQHKLADAIAAGANISAAIRYLKSTPDATVDEITKIAGQRQKNTRAGTPSSLDSNDWHLLADLLQTCFPDMPRMTAEAMASSGLLSEVRGVVSAQQVCFASRHAQSDFVLVVLCGLAVAMIEQLNYLLSKKPIYRQALRQSGVEWPYSLDSPSPNNRALTHSTHKHTSDDPTEFLSDHWTL